MLLGGTLDWHNLPLLLEYKQVEDYELVIDSLVHICTRGQKHGG